MGHASDAYFDAICVRSECPNGVTYRRIRADPMSSSAGPAYARLDVGKEIPEWGGAVLDRNLHEVRQNV
jgi:hypothetical protein